MRRETGSKSACSTKTFVLLFAMILLSILKRALKGNGILFCGHVSKPVLRRRGIKLASESGSKTLYFASIINSSPGGCADGTQNKQTWYSGVKSLRSSKLHSLVAFSPEKKARLFALLHVITHSYCS